MNRAQWNHLADDFETEVCDIAREETEDQLGRYVRAARPLPKKSVLVDLGCGLGSFIRRFQDRFLEITGVEYAPRIIARARKNCADVKNVKWLTMDIPRCAKTIGTVADLTVCMNVITSPSSAKRDAIWKTIAKVTKPDGHAIKIFDVSRMRGELGFEPKVGLEQGVRKTYGWFAKNISTKVRL